MEKQPTQCLLHTQVSLSPFSGLQLVCLWCFFIVVTNLNLCELPSRRLCNASYICWMVFKK